ncbi:toxin [Streptomyces sp. NPDC047023]|uniref:toxin n=1 Tax=Streptomyces sp. NPDC047023 TaxID=3155139 RepID=UPI0033E27FED
MNTKTLLSYCRDMVRRLDIPAPYDVNEVCDLMESRRGRPLSVLPMTMPVYEGSPSGIWIETEESDYILFQEKTSRAHQEHIVAHEIGHMLLNHRSSPADQDEVARLLMPNLDPSLVRTVLARTSYEALEEQQAEVVASLLPLQAGRARRSLPTRRAPAGVAPLIQHLERSLARGSGRV